MTHNLQNNEITGDLKLSSEESGFETSRMKIGVIGLGLMGSSITTALVVSGYQIIAVAPIPQDLVDAPGYLKVQLKHAQTLNLLDQPVDYYLNRITLTEDYVALQDCGLVLECVIEDRNIKSTVYQKIEAEVSSDAIIGTNTSAIPISSLQQYLKIPDRFMGIHWAEPAYATRFLEITCGSETDIQKAKWVSTRAEEWNKEPTLLHKDIRGFITNRLMYAVYREALSLEEKGVATITDLDKAARYDMGSWIPVMGVFRRMDYLGLQQEGEKVKKLLPKLTKTKKRPLLMQPIVDKKLRGVHSGKGMFSYTAKEAEQWRQAFSLFNRDMYFLSDKYAERKPSKIDKIKSS